MRIWNRNPHRGAPLTWAVLCSVALAGWGCTQRVPPVAELPPPEVTVSQPVEREFAEFAEFTGRTEAVEDVAIRARVSGYLESVNFEEGEEVAEGDVLFEIDPRPFQAALDSAKAEVARWEAALVKAQATEKRIRALQQRGASSQEELEQAVAEQQVAKASVEGAKAAQRQAELDLEFTKIEAPLAGRISLANFKKGSLIASGQTEATPLTTIVTIDPMHVYFDVDERTMLRLQKQAREKDPDAARERRRVSEENWPVFLGLPIEKGFPHEGVIDFVDNRVDPDTGTIRARARFDNQTRYLSPGLFVRVRVPISEPRKRLLVPERAIGTDQGQRYVMVVTGEDVAEHRNVTLGARTPDGLRTVEEGLSAGEWVIVDGIQRARPGVTVKPQRASIEEGTDAAAEPPADQATSPDDASSSQ